MDSLLVFLTEAFSRKRILFNFQNFFADYSADKDAASVLLEILNEYMTVYNQIVTFSRNEFPSENYLIKLPERFKNLNDFEKDLPSLYVEKMVSTFKTIYYNVVKTDSFNTSKLKFHSSASNIYNYFDSDSRINTITTDKKELEKAITQIYINYAILYLLRNIVSLNGVGNIMSNKLMEMEKKVFNNEFILGSLDLFINEINNKLVANKESKISRFKVFENDEIAVYKVDSSRDACIALGKGTDWCVANTNTDSHYKYYSSLGDMYVFIFKKIKNSYNGEGPEKVLLTLFNKNYNTDKIYKFLNLVKNKQYDKIKILLKIYHENENEAEIDLTETVFDFISLLKDSSILNIYNKYKYHKDISNTYFETSLTNYFENTTLPKPKLPAFLYDTIEKSVENYFKKFAENLIHNFEKYTSKVVDPEEMRTFSQVFNYAAKLNEVIRFGYSILIPEENITITSNEITEFTKFILKNRSKKTSEEIAKTNYFLKDSSNNDINLIKPKNRFSKTLVSLMYQWPELNSIVRKYIYEEEYFKIKSEFESNINIFKELANKNIHVFLTTNTINEAIKKLLKHLNFFNTLSNTYTVLNIDKIKMVFDSLRMNGTILEIFTNTITYELKIDRLIQLKSDFKIFIDKREYRFPKIEVIINKLKNPEFKTTFMFLFNNNLNAFGLNVLKINLSNFIKNVSNALNEMIARTIERWKREGVFDSDKFNKKDIINLNTKASKKDNILFLTDQIINKLKKYIKEGKI